MIEHTCTLCIRVVSKGSRQAKLKSLYLGKGKALQTFQKRLAKYVSIATLVPYTSYTTSSEQNTYS